jgi:hypothetical protein
VPGPFTCWLARLGAALVVALLGMSAHAQGGPPYVTDDPDTPGSGNWEINAAVTGAQNHQGWNLALPDLDINYGWGEHLQLKVDLNWASVQRVDGQRISGFGATDFGVKWRLLDQEQSGFSLSIYPQLSTNLVPSSAARGLIVDGRAFFAPVEVATEYGAFRLTAEVGPNFIEHEPVAWLAGVIAVHSCGPNLECGFELHGALTDHQLLPLVNVGVRWQITKHAILLVAAGREFGSNAEDVDGFVFYLGIQLLRES